MKQFKKCSILKYGNITYSDSSKPLDKAIERFNKNISPFKFNAKPTREELLQENFELKQEEKARNE